MNHSKQGHVYSEIQVLWLNPVSFFAQTMPGPCPFGDAGNIALNFPVAPLWFLRSVLVPGTCAKILECVRSASYLQIADWQRSHMAAGSGTSTTECRSHLEENQIHASSSHIPPRSRLEHYITSLMGMQNGGADRRAQSRIQLENSSFGSSFWRWSCRWPFLILLLLPFQLEST